MLEFWCENVCSCFTRGDMMLSDRDRKLLRIIANYSIGRNRFPTLRELQIKSGRAKDDVIAGLKLLEQEQYIELDDMGQVRKLLEAWERPGIPYRRR